MFSNPVKVIHTNSWYDKVKNIQNKLGIKNPLLVTSNGSLNRNKLDLYFSKNAIFSNILPDPTVESCQLAINSISTKIEERLNNTLDAYLVFNDNYPESEHSKQAEKIQLDTKQSLKKINKQ